MLGQFDHFHERIIRARARELHTVRCELIAIAVVELVPMAMTFGNLCLPITVCGHTARLESCRLSAKPHRAAFVCDRLLRV